MISGFRPRRILVVSVGKIIDPLIHEILVGTDLQLNFAMVPFVVASDTPQWEKWNATKIGVELGVGLGASGCLIAHQNSWRMANRAKYPAILVLEDDSKITNFGKSNLRSVIYEFIDSNKNLLHLGSHEKNLITRPIHTLFQYGIRRYCKELLERFLLLPFPPKYANRQFPFSTHAYLMRPDFAAILLNLDFGFLTPVDVILNGMSQAKQNRIGRVRTPLFVQDRRIKSRVEMNGR